MHGDTDACNVVFIPFLLAPIPQAIIWDIFAVVLAHAGLRLDHENPSDHMVVYHNRTGRVKTVLRVPCRDFRRAIMQTCDGYARALKGWHCSYRSMNIHTVID